MSRGVKLMNSLYGTKVCMNCGKRFYPDAKDTHRIYCDECKQQKRTYLTICPDCSKEFKISVKDHQTIYCRECYKKHYKEIRKKINAKYYRNHKKLRQEQM